VPISTNATPNIELIITGSALTSGSLAHLSPVDFQPDGSSKTDFNIAVANFCDGTVLDRVRMLSYWDASEAFRT
jgi:hypothetical protein